MGPVLLRNTELAARFELLADLLELDGADPFRPAAYRRAAVRIRESAVSIAELAVGGKATQLSGIGSTIQAKIVELVETGDLATLAKLRARIPEGVVDVMHVPGLGPKTARRLWQELGIAGLADLHSAADSQRLRSLPGLGVKTEQNVLRAIADAENRTPVSSGALLGHALPFVEEVVRELRSHPACDRVSEAGSVRRRVETVRDLDVIATSAQPEPLIERFLSFPWVVETIARGQTKATALSQTGLRFDLRVVPPECFGNLLQHFTGSKEHNIALREDAVRRGLSVSEWGVEAVETGDVATMATEEELYASLGYAWIPPELRENRGELEAARAGTLPTLVTGTDLRGDLHSHTDWSDGKASLEEMVAAAKARGYEYLAVCDHAKRLHGGLLERQAERIAELNEQLDGFRVLSGVEVDIRSDGSLDLDETSLVARDWVVASVHSGFRDSRRQVTSRVLAALESEHVDCIGHLTGRKIGRRAPCDLDLEAIFRRAAETGTFLEINGQPDRLDLRDTHARAAAEAGVRIVLSSDAHSPTALEYIELSAAQARRAWLVKANVLNTRSWREVEKLMKR